MRILQLCLFLPWVLTCVALWCIFIFPLANWFFHEENVLKLIIQVFFLANNKDSACFNELVDPRSWPVLAVIFLHIMVKDDGIPERFLKAVLILDEVCEALDHFSLRSAISNNA